MARNSIFFSFLALAVLCTPLGFPGALGDSSGSQAAPSEYECRPYIEKALKELTPTPEAPEAPGSIDESSPSEPPSEGVGVATQEEAQESVPEVLQDGESITETISEEAPLAESESIEASKEEQEASEASSEEPAPEAVEESITEPIEETQPVEEAVAEEPVIESKEEAPEEVVLEEIEPSKEELSEEPAPEESSSEEAQQPIVEEVDSASESETPEAPVEPETVPEEQEDQPIEDAVEEKVSEPVAEEVAEPSTEEEALPAEEGTAEPISEEQAEPAPEISIGEQTAEEPVTEEQAPEPIEEAALDEEPVAVPAEPEAQEPAAEPAEPAAEPAEPAVESAEPAAEPTEAAPAEEPSTTPEELAEPTSEALPESIDVEATQPSEIPEVSAPEAGDETKGPVAAEEEATPEEEDLTMTIEIPEKLRPRDHISEILRLDGESAETELLLSKTIDSTLRDLKRVYEAAIKPLEVLYKYRDLSNRHFGDPEIFSKPLILFMGPWSGGKSTIINYLLDNEYRTTSLRTGAEPSPAYFNIVMWGEREEVLDGTQLAADWTFSGLQKFGQGLLDRLRGLRMNKPLLEKVNIVEIPGILEIRKQVERLFPFNDACQWFIDRADIIFLVYDPSKLDVGPESEAILDQLKGREYQTRIILNKADQVRPEELMRVQGTLIWNISPLMSSTEPPVMYSTSLWSLPYESGAPTRLLYAQEKAFLKDLREAVDKRVENKIASARRFAVRVRNHAKMVDCYLTTYYNHKSFFGNRKKISDDIIEHPQNYHIYEGLSTLTNISRYDLPDPEVYKDFFRLNPVYDFQQLSATCTYFRGCPINRLDVAIAYELPELVGKYKKNAEEVLLAAKKEKNS